MRGQGKVWVREAEHIVLRVISLLLSLSSAHAIHWFFGPLEGADVLQVYINWVIAGSIGVLGFFVSRGLAHRMMNKESVWLYVPICVAVEFIEIFCNYALAASMIVNATWLHSVPEIQRHVLETMTYVVLSSIPPLGVFLAVVDMDMIRKRTGGASAPPARGGQQLKWNDPGNSSAYQGGYAGNGWQQQQAKQAAGGSANGATPLAGVTTSN
jgi:hypothetical protein